MDDLKELMDDSRPPTEILGASASTLADDLFGQDAELAYLPSTADIAPTASGSAAEPTAEVAEDAEEDESGGLFGDDGDDDEDEAMASAPEAARPDEDDDPERSDEDEEQRAERERLEYNEDYAQPAVPRTQTTANIPIPNTGLPPESKVWHARLPNYLALVKTAFDPNDETTWEDDVSAKVDKVQDGERKPSLPVADEDKIRWRWIKDPVTGEAVKQSNSRMIRWSDGSLTLQIGSEQYAVSAALDHSAPLLTSHIKPDTTLATPAPIALSNFDKTRGHGLTYLVADITEFADQVHEAQASIHGTLTFRPMTTQGKTHKRLAGNIAEKYVKARGIKVTLAEEDPERVRLDREKADMERIKQAKKAARGTRSAKKQKKDTRFIGADDEEGEDEDEEMETTGDRRSNPKRGRGGPLAGADSDEEDDDGFVVDSDEEDDDKRGARRKLGDVTGAEMDAVEEAEAIMERNERRRKSKNDDSAQEPAVAPMRRMVVDDDDE